MYVSKDEDKRLASPANAYTLAYAVTVEEPG